MFWVKEKRRDIMKNQNEETSPRENTKPTISNSPEYLKRLALVSRTDFEVEVLSRLEIIGNDVHRCVAKVNKVAKLLEMV